MATTRKRSTSGFAPKGEEVVSEPDTIEEAAELTEDTADAQEEVIAVQETYSIPEIVPTEDPGPRFVEEPPKMPAPVVATPPVAPRKAAPQLQPPPKRHPRNVPKFSNFK